MKDIMFIAGLTLWAFSFWDIIKSSFLKGSVISDKYSNLIQFLGLSLIIFSWYLV